MKLSEIVPELFFVPNNLVSWSEMDDKRIDCALHMWQTRFKVQGCSIDLYADDTLVYFAS